jgi:hypothetical protein
MIGAWFTVGISLASVALPGLLGAGGLVLGGLGVGALTLMGMCRGHYTDKKENKIFLI